MQVIDPSNFRMAKAIDFLRADVPKSLVLGYVTFLILGYIVIATHTPMTVYPGASYDDGLFITLGQYLAEGHWLGPYNQFTLIKGPGYPAFLAVAQWLGLSLSLARAVLHCFAVAAFVIVLHRFIGSFLLSGLLFTLLLWHPVSLSVHLLRVFREQIYYCQVLLVFAAFVAVFFIPLGKSFRILSAVLCGVVLGWFWLTREEGAWIFPGIALLVAIAGWRAFRTSKVRGMLVPLTIIVCTFAMTQIGFRGINLLVYGKFVGVEVKEANFQRALGEIDSVISGGNKPFISVTAASRALIYDVSPAFGSLKSYFEDPQRAPWEKLTCNFYPSSCGEIAAGWFLWVLREAVAQNGHFSSPTSASAFFKQIADEISAACTRGQLKCSPQIVPEMPQTNFNDFVERLPSRYIAVAHLLMMTNPPFQFNPSSGTEAQLTPALRFLNYPVYTKSTDWVEPPTKYRLSAWYYRSGSDWMLPNIKNVDGTPAQTQVFRVPSPDLQSGFKDPEASQQRFMLETTCIDTCVLQIENPEGEKAEKTLGEIRNGAPDIRVGSGTVHVDSTELASDLLAPTRIDAFCNRLRKFLMSYYSWLSIPALVLGALSFLISIVLYWRTAMSNVCFLMAAVCWLLVLVRCSLMVLIDATSFPAMVGFYLAPAHFLLMSGAVLSCAALLNLARPGGGLREADA
jgi:hypothetical protein